jgi:glucan 1,3-beta-glucosidase
MRFSSVIPVLLVAQAFAAPVPEPNLSSLFSSISNTVNLLLSSLGVSIQTNGGTHGSTWNYHDLKFPQVIVAIQRFKHNLVWKNHVNFIDWKTYKANGVNLGAWLEQEKDYDIEFWNTGAPDAPDEWTWCQVLGPKCGPLLEKRYASWVTAADIDKLAATGINTLRIPTTYAAWIDWPESEFYHGNQQQYLKTITNYAIENYGMHIIVGLHSLPGGVNSWVAFLFMKLGCTNVV